MFRAVSLRSRSGWTLVEILVIVAVIAILASILFPMFARVRLMGYQVKCAANMRQLGLAFNTYSQDWSDYWPSPGGVAGNWSYWSQSGSGGLQGYVKQRGTQSVWCCPLMPMWTSMKYPARTYTMNSYLRKRPDVEYPNCCNRSKDMLTGARANCIPEASNTILLFEGLPLTISWEDNGYYVYIYRCCNWTGVKGYYQKLAYTIDPAHPWHGKVNNYLYCDGHLQARQPGRKTSGALSTYKEMREWYVDKAQFERVYQSEWSKIAPMR